MRLNSWEHSRHLSEDELLRTHDGELGPADATRVRAHLETCWQCRGRLERLSAVVVDFVAYCDAVAATAAPSAQGNRRRELLHRTPLALSVPLRIRVYERWKTLVPPPGSLRALASAVCILVLLYWFLAGKGVATAEAGELLRQTHNRRQTQLRSAPGSFVHQRLLFSKGSERVEWQAWRAVSSSQSRESWTASPRFLADLRQTFGLHRMDSSDWLSTSNFIHWRNSVADREERVTADAGRGEIRIWIRDRSARKNHQIREASLTMRSADLHPIAQSLHAVSDGVPCHYELRELAFAIVPPDRLPAEVFPAPAAQAVTSSSAVLKGDRPEHPGDLQLDESEASLREALHVHGFDRNLSPRIYRENHQVVLQLIVPESKQKITLLETLAGVPHLNLQIWDADSPIGDIALAPVVTVEPPTSRFRVEPAMRRHLIDHFGSPELLTSYIDRTHASLRGTLREALALERLATRYSDTGVLGDNVRPVVHRIAADHIEQISTRWADAHRLLLPVFAAGPRKAHSVPPNCLGWAESARLLVRQLRELEAHFDGLAVEQDRDRPFELSPEVMRSKLRSLLEEIDQEVTTLCTPH